MTLSSTILIVDDTPAIHTMISALLRDEPYQLEHAYSGEEALVKAQDLAPDLILLDIMMPDIDGFEVCRRLRGASGVAEVPIIMLTALSDRASRLQGLAAGADDFVSKPFDQTELRIRIKTITRLDRYRRLLAERARFDRLVELAPDGVLIVAGDGRIRLANPAIVRLLGLEDEQTALGRRFVDFVSNSQRDRWLSFFARAEQAVGDSDIVESLLQRANGEQSPVEITAGAFEWDGKSVVQMLVRDITGRKLTEEALQKRNLELRRLAARLAEAQELERQNLARELHDLVGQNLTAINLNLNIIDQSLYKDFPSAVRNRLSDSLQLIEETTRQVRTVMSELRPPMLDDFGLLPTLRWQLEQFSDRTGIAIRLEGDEPTPRLPRNVELTQYRICQEALTNAAKHSNASEVSVALSTTDQVSHLTVEDNGRGFDPQEQTNAANDGHWGLLTMQDRARSVGGVVTVVSAPGLGTRIVSEVPLG
ncbi:MAG: response regulator [Anaerolineae bacterium]|nr:response regulator [Anaerolineae bacterium]MCB9133539.1 response regulator [Anaerolineales bacterium]MCB0231372.1 response regulator [Anaerolineae bacterium]MCB0235472.1 response regulator [Anaerolineae bacterium]MCB0243695.1 response regulator [Anaerolineae bacterium]